MKGWAQEPQDECESVMWPDSGRLSPHSPRLMAALSALSYSPFSFSSRLSPIWELYIDIVHAPSDINPRGLEKLVAVKVIYHYVPQHELANFFRFRE